MATNFESYPRIDADNIDDLSANGVFGQAPNTAAPASMTFDDFDYSSLPALDEESEIANLSQAMTQDADTRVDNNGVIHIEGEPDQENSVRVSGKVFGSAEQDELNRLAQVMQNDGGEYWVDEFGRIRLNGEPGAGENMTRVDGNIFGSDEQDEIARLAAAMQDDDEVFVDHNGIIRMHGEVDPQSNAVKLDGNIFGAHEDQWYNKNPMLFRAEVATMRKHYPKAGYNFYQSNGNMYWLVTLKIFKNEGVTKPWVFQLVYDKDHPHNHGFGGSIKVVPLKPSLDDLKKIATQHGRPGVPHIISNNSHFLTRYLCTRWPKDIESGDELVSSATQAAAWAADWAAHFEVGIRDACVWNKWCADDHFRWMQVTCNKKNCPHRVCPYGKRG